MSRSEHFDTLRRGWSKLNDSGSRPVLLRPVLSVPRKTAAQRIGLCFIYDKEGKQII